MAVTSSCDPCIRPSWQAARALALPHLLLWLPDASILHLPIRITDFTSLPPPSAPGTTPRCGTEIPLYCVHAILIQAAYLKIVHANWGSARITNIPALAVSICNFQLPQYHIHPFKIHLAELSVIHIPGNCVSHTVCQRALTLFRRKGILTSGIYGVFFSRDGAELAGYCET